MAQCFGVGNDRTPGKVPKGRLSPQRSKFAVRLCSPIAIFALSCSALAVATPQITTTIYVSRHFEVRDYDQPTKYVFNGATRVAEITGSLSANVRAQRLRLYPGWNLCSLAVRGTLPATGAETIAAAYQWNPGIGDYSPIASGQTLTAGTVLWVKARTNAVMSVLGAYVDPVPSQIQAGGTYIPGMGMEVWSPSLPASVSTWEFDGSTAQWSAYLAGDLATISGLPPSLGPGQALYLKAAAPAEVQIPDPTLRIRYYHQDHLGSSTALTDANGALAQETAFYPFGASRNEYRLRPVEKPYQFTQKERDRESGLHYFEARYLGAHLSRFVTPDPKYANNDLLSAKDASSFVSNPQEINAYAYVRNNPPRYTDPDGLKPQKTYMEFKMEEVFTSTPEPTRTWRDELADMRLKPAQAVGPMLLEAFPEPTASVGIVFPWPGLGGGAAATESVVASTTLRGAAGTAARTLPGWQAPTAVATTAARTLPGWQAVTPVVGAAGGELTKDAWIFAEIAAASGTRLAVQKAGGNAFVEVIEPIMRRAAQIFGGY